LYRNALAAARVRLEQAQTRVASRVERLTDELRESLPAELRVRLALCDLDSQPLGDDLGAVLDAERALSGYERALDEVEHLLPEIERSVNNLPDAVPAEILGSAEWVPCEGPGIALGLARACERLHALLDDFVLEHDPEATVAVASLETDVVEGRARGAFRVEVDFRSEGTPFVLRARPIVDARERPAVGVALGTAVRRSTPTVYLRERTWRDMLRRGERLGHAELDRRFFVEAASDAVRKLFDAEARAALARARISLLAIEDGSASVRWKLGLDDALTLASLDAGRTLLARIRAADTALPLRRR
jgi:hypothetical protein